MKSMICQMLAIGMIINPLFVTQTVHASDEQQQEFQVLEEVFDTRKNARKRIQVFYNEFFSKNEDEEYQVSDKEYQQKMNQAAETVRRFVEEKIDNEKRADYILTNARWLEKMSDPKYRDHIRIKLQQEMAKNAHNGVPLALAGGVIFFFGSLELQWTNWFDLPYTFMFIGASMVVVSAFTLDGEQADFH